MKTIVDYLQQKNLMFKSLKEITPKELGSRKKIGLYLGIDMKGYYALVMTIEKKSRILRKEGFSTGCFEEGKNAVKVCKYLKI